MFMNFFNCAQMCCIILQGYYETNLKVATYGFPKTEEMKNKWIAIIHREDYIAAKQSRDLFIADL